MRNGFHKSLIVAAAMFLIAVATIAVPNTADARWGGGWHGGWHGGHWHHGGWGWGVGAGFLGGLALGAAAGYPYYGYGYPAYGYYGDPYGYGGDCAVRRRVFFDEYGHRHVRRITVCY